MMHAETSYSLEAKIINGLTEPLTLGDLSDKINVSPSALLKALQFMHQKQQIDCQQHMELAKAFWCRKGAPLIAGATLVTGVRRAPVKPPIESKATITVQPKADVVSYAETRNVEKPHGPQTKSCVHGTPPYTFCSQCFVENRKQEAPMETPAIDIDRVHERLDRRSSEFKNSKRRLIRQHQIVSEISAELQADGSIHIFDLLPLEEGKPKKVEQEFAVPYDCIDGLCETLQSLKKLHERAKG